MPTTTPKPTQQATKAATASAKPTPMATGEWEAQTPTVPTKAQVQMVDGTQLSLSEPLSIQGDLEADCGWHFLDLATMAQMDLGPRPTGSEAGWKTGEYIIEQLKQSGWTVETQEFEYQGVKARNIVGKRGSGPVTIIGAHYDTRRQADKDPDPARRTQPVVGANDGASGVAVLLEMARTLDVDKTQREIWLTFFDAEDNGRLDGWDWIAGSTYMAQNLSVTPTAMILLDIIDDADQQLYWERNSHPQLNASIWQTAASLGFAQQFIPQYTWLGHVGNSQYLLRKPPPKKSEEADQSRAEIRRGEDVMKAPEKGNRAGTGRQCFRKDWPWWNWS